MIDKVIGKVELNKYLAKLDIKKGMVLYVCVDVEKLPYIVGGCQALIEALMDSVGYEGTLIVDTFTRYLHDPSNGGVKFPRSEWNKIREGEHVFHRKRSLVKNNEFAQQFLLNEGVLRSYHPLYSFAAWGKYAKVICDKHPLHFGLNQDSPLGKIVDFNGYVLMLGAEYDQCNMFHLARYQNDRETIRIHCSPIEINKNKVWKDMLDLEWDCSGFEAIGKAMEERCDVKKCCIDHCLCRLFMAKDATNMANSYLHIYKSEY